MEADNLRLDFLGGEEPALILIAKTDNERKRVCTLNARGLKDVKLFATQFPFPSGNLAWEVSKKSEQSLTMHLNLGERNFCLEFAIVSNPTRLQVKSSLTLLGDELVEWFRDRWTFLAGMPLDFAFASNLRPEADLTIGDNVFRVPATILLKDGIWSALIPNLESLGEVKHPHTMSADLNIKQDAMPTFDYGLMAYQPVSDTYYRHAESMLFSLPPGRVSFSYEIFAGADGNRSPITRTVTSYHCQRFASKYVGSPSPQTIPFSKYSKYSYPTLLKSGELCELRIGEKKVGGFKALNDGGYFRRPEHVLLNQAWYNNMRSAYGLFHFGKKPRRKAWSDRAKMIRSWTLSAPQVHGLFPAMYDLKKKEWRGSIPRLNRGRNRTECVNAAWTSVWLLWWSRDFVRDDVSLYYVRSFADFLVSNQLPSGAIPSWFDLPANKGEFPRVVETLKESAETAGSAIFLGELVALTGDRRYFTSLTGAADFLMEQVMPEMKYWDFETL